MILSTEVEAAVAYDAESVQRRGLEAITNFALDEYTDLLSEHPSAVFMSNPLLLGRRLHLEQWQMHVEAQVGCKLSK